MAEAAAFELHSELAGSITTQDGDIPRFQGATVSLADGGMFNIGEALEAAAGGPIVTHEQELIDRLRDRSEVLTEIAAPAGASTVDTYEDRDMAQLLALPQVRDVPGASSLSKAKLIGAYRALDRREPVEASPPPAVSTVPPAPAPAGPSEADRRAAFNALEKDALVELADGDGVPVKKSDSKPTIIDALVLAGTALPTTPEA
jgi:hypothetical protein